jgi:16S rRNA (uracil1498-N3)-methyltransferase
LRVQTGQTIFLGDEQRRRHRATVRQIEKDQLVADIQETQCGPDPEVPSVILGQSVLKSEKMTWVIQKATELGVTHIVPLLTERVIPRLSSAQAKRHQDRWQRIALEAAQQSERWEVPTVSAPQPFGEFCVAKRPKELSLILVEREPRGPLNSIALPTQWENSLTLLVGPEGGWTEDELTEAEKSGYQKVSLGTRILRAETATMAALSILQARLGHLGS